MKTTLTIVILLIFQSFIYCQEEYPLTFEDGEEITLLIYHNNPDEVDKGLIYTGLFLSPQRLDLLGASYYSPNKFFINTTIGPKGGILDGNILFFNTIRNSSIKRSIDFNYNTAYKAKIPVRKRLSMGVHLGIEHFSNFLSEEGIFLPNEINATGAIGGLSIISAKHSKWGVKPKGYFGSSSSISENDKKIFTKFARLNVDCIYYFQKTFGEDSIYNDDDIRQIGARVYYEGRFDIWRTNGTFRIVYKFGLELPLNKTDFGSPVIMGLGLGWGFHKSEL